LSFISVFEFQIHVTFGSGRDFERRDSVGEVSRVESVGGGSGKHAHHLSVLQDDGDHDGRNYMYVVILTTSDIKRIKDNIVSFSHAIIKCCM